jgi:hypothetical protein
VPGLPGDDRVERAASGIPGLEGRHLGSDAGRPGELGHPPVGVDPEHRAAGGQELPGGYAGAAADVEHVPPRAGGDDPLHQRVGIWGAGAVVARGVRAERLRDLPGLVGF